MHALSLKVFIEFNATTRTCLLGRETYNSADLAPGKRRVGWGCKDLTRTCGIVASVGGGGGGCGGESLSSKSGSGELSPSSFLSRTQTYALLRQQMEVAAKSEVGILLKCFSSLEKYPTFVISFAKLALFKSKSMAAKFSFLVPRKQQKSSLSIHFNQLPSFQLFSDFFLSFVPYCNQMNEELCT